MKDVAVIGKLMREFWKFKSHIPPSEIYFQRLVVFVSQQIVFVNSYEHDSVRNFYRDYSQFPHERQRSPLGKAGELVRGPFCFHI